MSSSSVSLRRQTFLKNERLCSRTILKDLALKGKNIRVNPFRLQYLLVQLNTTQPAQIAFSVPKKIFKNSVDRNRIRRRMREAYRKNKSTFYSFISSDKMQIALLFVFTGKNIVSFVETEEKTKIILKRLAEDIQKNNP
jgi:ribonuclease P protein component